MRAYVNRFAMAQRVATAARDLGYKVTLMPVHPTGGKPTGWRISWS